MSKPSRTLLPPRRDLKIKNQDGTLRITVRLAGFKPEFRRKLRNAEVPPSTAVTTTLRIVKQVYADFGMGAEGKCSEYGRSLEPLCILYRLFCMLLTQRLVLKQTLRQLSCLVPLFYPNLPLYLACR